MKIMKQMNKHWNSVQDLKVIIYVDALVQLLGQNKDTHKKLKKKINGMIC